MSVKFLRSSSNVVECEVVLLDNSHFISIFDQKRVRGEELFDRVCVKVQVPSYYKQYFGLQFVDRDDGDLNWLDLTKEIQNSRKSKEILYQFAVKVFPQDPVTLEKNMQRQIILQVKALISRGRVSLPVNTHAVLDGFYAQAILGDFASKKHTPGYLEDLLGVFYSPPTGINSDGDISEGEYEVKVRDFHKSHRGMTHEEAFSAYLDVCKELPYYGIFVHFGALDLDGNVVAIAVSNSGIRVCKLDEFNHVGKVCHDVKWRDVVSMFCNNAKFFLYLAEDSNKQCVTSLVYRFSHGHFGHKDAQRLLVDAENHQTFFLEANPERGQIIRSLSLDLRQRNRLGTGQFLGVNLPFRRGSERSNRVK